MKQFAMILFVLGFVSVAFAAEEAKKDLPLKVGVSGVAYGTTFAGVVKDAEGDYSGSRIRPLFTFTNGDIEAVVKLEIDSYWGSEVSTEDKTTTSTGIGADKKAVEVANAYISTKVDGVAGLTLKGGIANYDFPLIFGENVPMANVNFANDMVDVGLYYIKTAEGKADASSDDAQIYIADAKIKFGESSVRPAFFAYDIKQNADLLSVNYKGSKGYIGGLSLNLVMGTMGVDLSAAYAQGKDKPAAGDAKKYSGYAVDFAPYIKIDTIKVTPFLTMVSGDDNASATKSTSFNDATIDGGNTGVNNWRLYIIEDGGSATGGDPTGGKLSYTDCGYMAFGLSVDATFGRLTAKLQGAYAQAAKVPTGGKKDLGIEIDANIGFALTKSSTLFVEGAYLKTGKFYENSGAKKQDASFYTVGVSYSI